MADGYEDKTPFRVEPDQAAEGYVDFRTLVENAREAIMVAQEGNVRYASPSVVNLIGYTPAECLAMPGSQIIHPQDRKMVMDRHERRMRGESMPDRYVLRLQHKNGSTVWAEMSAVPIEWNGRTASLNYLTDVSERMEAEAKLHESEAILHTIQQAAPIGVGLALPGERRIVWANQRVCELTGYSNQELVAMDTALLYENEETFQRARKIFSENFGGGPGSAETRWRRKDGSCYDILMNFAPVGTEGSEPGVVFTIMDLSHVKQAESARRLSEEKFQKAFRNNPAWIAITTMDEALFLEVNDAFSHGTGYSREETLGRSAKELGLWVNNSDFTKAMELLKRDGYVRNMEFSTRIKSGEIRHILWSTEAIEYDGKPCRINVMVDVTEQKLAERALRDREERLRALVESSSDAIVTLDSEGDFVSSNPAFCRQFKLSQEEINGQPAEMIHVSPEAYQQFAREAYPVVNRLGSFRGEYNYRDRDGRTFPMETVLSALKRADGEVSGYVAVMRDTSERRRAEQERARLENQLRQAQKMEAIGTLAGGIAHDFNNILTAIIGYTELLLTEISPKTTAGNSLEQVLLAGVRAKELVNQILTFSRQGDQEMKPANLSAVVKEALKLLRSSLPTTIEIRQDISDDMGTVLIDPTQVHQLLLNLCTNAAQAMEPHGGVLGVSLQRTRIENPQRVYGGQLRAGEYYLLKVSDTGKGMEPELLDKIFDPYFTTKRVGQGTGLGLSVVHGVVTAHQGGVQVKSVPDAGTTFQVYLPASAKARMEERRDAEPLPTGTESVLLVDDEPILTDVGRKTLTHLGYQVTAVNDSRDALNVFQQRPDSFDLVITDQTMPGLTGMELAQRVLDLRSDIPIILCTGFSNQVDRNQALEAGVKEFLMKPVMTSTLARAVRQVLDGGGEKAGE